jgi:aspartyl-tRNA(Asn)/glutamyl-tRNA(Gln) amidotransferase subunit A
MTDLTQLTLSDAVDGLKAKTFSSQEITQAFLTQIEKSNATLNAYVVVTADKALEMAKASDAKLAKGQGGKLEGAPLGIKDLFCTKGVRSTACSRILGNFIPEYESTVTANLFGDGAVMLGKLNMDEFAMGSSNETSAFGPVVNPWKVAGGNQSLTPGGSSGGSAAAVAADLCLGATATDTGERNAPCNGMRDRMLKKTSPVAPCPFVVVARVART